jgi:hypothetical protein
LPSRQKVWGTVLRRVARRRHSVFSRFASAAIVCAGSAISPASAQIADFLGTIEGQAVPIDKWGSENIPMSRDQAELLGQRFVREKLPTDADAVGLRARAQFVAECRVKGGVIEPQEGLTTSAFSNRVLQGVPLRSPAKEQWRAFVSVCSRDAENVLGGFVAIIHDTTGIARRGDMGSRFMMRLMNIPTVTGIYAYRPDRIATRASLERQTVANRQAMATAQAESDARLKRFYATMAVGTETNCGTVIQLRGPLAEVAIPLSRPAINGQRTFWSRQERLFPADEAICTYGL